MFTLCYSEQGESKAYDLPAGDTVAGRSPSCDLVLDDVSVSRRHARFTVDNGACTLGDLGSRNGVYRNGEMITESPINDGDVVVLGRFSLEIRHSLDEQLVLSEDRALLEDPGTIYRPVAPPETLFGRAAADSPVRELLAADAPRLLRVFFDVARTLARSRSLPEVLGRVVDLTFENVPAERAFIVLVDERSGELVPRLARSRDGSTPQRASISRTIVRTVISERMAMLAADVRFDPRLSAAESILAFDVRSFMCAPLWDEDQVIGILYVDNPRSKEFSSLDLDLLTALSNYAAIAIEQARLEERVLTEKRRRERLERYHSPAVVERILQGDAASEIAFIAQERDLSVLFLDIVGFTAFAEQLPPARVARTLNEFFSRMTDVVFQHEGMLDKFIGDALLAVFGAPLDQPDHPLRAVRAALDMRTALAAFNGDRPDDQPLEVRIAVSTGVSLVGDIGSPRRREFTVLGDVVNTASRLESSVAQPGQIVMTRATYDRVRDRVAVRPLGPVTLRGRAGEVEVFELQA